MNKINVITNEHFKKINISHDSSVDECSYSVCTLRCKLL